MNTGNNIDEKMLLDDERIVNYLKGRMTAEEEQEFMQELQENPELKAKAIAMARMVKGMKEVGTTNDEELMGEFLASSGNLVEDVAKQAIQKAADNEIVEKATRMEKAVIRFATVLGIDLPEDGNQMDAATEIIERFTSDFEDIARRKPAVACASVDISDDKDVPSHKQEKTKKANVISWRRTVTWLSAAATVALLIWAGIGYNDYRNTTGLGEQYATVFTSSQLTRGGENGEVELKLMNLMDNVAQKKDMDNTLHELALCWELATQDTYNDYTDYAPEIGWNLAIGHLKNNNRKQAKAVLEKLIGVAPAGTAIGDKARELQKKVDEL